MTPQRFMDAANRACSWPLAGKPLPMGLRRSMERLFRADFSRVRIHVGPQASWLGAQAFALGEDLYFAPGRYQPRTRAGQGLIAHELTHVLQQRQGRVRSPFGPGLAVVDDPVLEAEAHRVEALVERGLPLPWDVLQPRDALATGSASPRVLQARWHQEDDKTLAQWIPGRGDASAGSYRYVGDDFFRRVLEGRGLEYALYRWNPSADELSSVSLTRSLERTLSEGGLSEGVDFDPGDVLVEDRTNVTLFGLQYNAQEWIEYDTASRTLLLKDREGSSRELDGPSSGMPSEGFPSKLRYRGQFLHPLTKKVTGLEPTKKVIYYLPTERHQKAFEPTVHPIESTTGLPGARQKAISDRITKENLLIWEPIRTRSKSQKSVMKNKSAADEVRALGMVAEPNQWHWCHLIAHSMGTLGNPQVPRNLVAGTKGCNGAMAHLETAIKSFVMTVSLEVDLVVDVIADLIQPTHVASRILYKVSNPLYDTEAVFHFYPLEPNLSAIQHQDYYLAALMDQLLPSRELVSTPERTSFLRTTEPRKHFTTPVRPEERTVLSLPLRSPRLDDIFPAEQERPIVTLSLPDGSMISGTLHGPQGGSHYLIETDANVFVFATREREGLYKAD